MKQFIFALAVCLSAQPACSLDLKGVDPCDNDVYLQEQMLKRYVDIQRDHYRSLPWQVFIVMREFQSNGFKITNLIHETVCGGDRWLYGDSPDDFTVPKQFQRIGPSVFDTVG